MPATTRFTHHPLPEPPALYLALELSNRSWKLAFSTGLGQKPRMRSIPARDLEVLEREIAAARRRFRLDEALPLVSCYEAGRDGFWIHRFLTSEPRRHNLVVDSASIDVKRRHRRLKTDRIDATKLLNMLIRYHNGEDHVWSVVHVPSREAEDARHLHRELGTVKAERTRVTNRVKGLLVTQGVAYRSVGRGLTLTSMPYAYGTVRLCRPSSSSACTANGRIARCSPSASASSSVSRNSGSKTAPVPPSRWSISS